LVVRNRLRGLIINFERHEIDCADAMRRASSRDCKNTDVRFGSKADMTSRNRDVRFPPESGHCRAPVGCPLCAITGHAANYSNGPCALRRRYQPVCWRLWP
jgi:hypothetical protein